MPNARMLINENPRPTLWTTVVEHAPGEWMAYGTRRINYLDIESIIDDGLEMSYFGGLVREMAPCTLREIIIKGSIRGLNMTTGTSALGALGSLLEMFHKEEIEEAVHKERYKHSDYTRFGGNIDDELLKKIKKLVAKQQAKVAEAVEEGYYDD